MDRRQAPRALVRALPKLRRASRRASRKQPGSLNRRKAWRRLNRIHGRIADQRRHATHEVTTKLVKTHDRICMEDLGELHRQLTYKATWYGSQLASAPRWFASSKICSNCGSVHQNLNLSKRVLHCDTNGGGCGLVIDRDLNAAVNLAAWAEAEYRSAPQTPDPQAGGRATNACGGTGAGYRARGGEPGPAIPPGKRQEPISATSNWQRDRTPEKGADGQPEGLSHRL